MPRALFVLLALLPLVARAEDAGDQGGARPLPGRFLQFAPNVTALAGPPAPPAAAAGQRPALRYLGRPHGSNIGEHGSDDRGCEAYVKEEFRGPINFGGYRLEDRSPEQLYCYCFVYRLRPEALDGSHPSAFRTPLTRAERHNCSADYVADRAECALPLPAKGEPSLAGVHRPGRWSMITECEQEKRGRAILSYYGHRCSDQLFGWFWEGRDCSQQEGQKAWAVPSYGVNINTLCHQ